MKLLKDSGQQFKESLERRIKGRQLRREREEEKANGGKKLQHYKDGEKPSPLPRVPKTKQEMQAHLSGRSKHLFRDPMTRSERREWDKWWKLKGTGYTKPERKGERFK